MRAVQWFGVTLGHCSASVLLPRLKAKVAIPVPAHAYTHKQPLPPLRWMILGTGVSPRALACVWRCVACSVLCVGCEPPDVWKTLCCIGLLLCITTQMGPCICDLPGISYQCCDNITVCTVALMFNIASPPYFRLYLWSPCVRQN